MLSCLGACFILVQDLKGNSVSKTSDDVIKVIKPKVSLYAHLATKKLSKVKKKYF